MVVHGRFGDGFGKTRPAPGTTEKHRTLGKFGLSNLVPVGHATGLSALPAQRSRRGRLGRLGPLQA